MKIENLMELLPDNYTAIDRETILRAYQFANHAHSGQKRASGEPYISHCIEVAAILTDLRVPPTVIITALLHDTVENTALTLDDIRKEFGTDVATQVDGVTKLTQLPQVVRADQFEETIPSKPSVDKSTQLAHTTQEEINKRSRTVASRNETIRKAFLAMSQDIGVVLIKLADRLHNMRTLSYVTPESKRVRIAQETLDIFAPLANRLGIWRIKWELEDLSFRYVDPEKFKEIANNINEHQSSREREINEITVNLKKVLDAAGIEADISGRPKHIYSIYKKMVSKSKAFDQILDLRGIRLIVSDIPKCYTTLGIIHTTWRPIIQEFDDYIAAPKDNYYMSLHTTVIFDDGKPLEVQIRTPEMDEDAEFGIAAHWHYKETGKSVPIEVVNKDLREKAAHSDETSEDTISLPSIESHGSTPAQTKSIRDETYEKRLNWLRKLMEWRQDVEDADEFSEGMKIDVFQDRVYVFTPRGDIIDLPAGATPIDFAYHVHTDVGNRCRGAKINGKLVTLDYNLQTGDQVEILTAKQGGPSRDWLNTNLGMVNTQRARSKIRQWFKKQDYTQNLSQGRSLFEKELSRLGLEDIELDTLVKAFDFKNAEGFYVSIGNGDLSINRIINKLGEIFAGKAGVDPLFKLSAPSEVTGRKDEVFVYGLKGILTTLASCCNPTPGDDITGYITRGRGVTIHRQDCPNILNRDDKERIIKVSWGERRTTYPITVEVKAYDRQGLIGDLSNILKDENINLLDVKIKVSHNLASFSLMLEVDEINHLSRVLNRMENLPNIIDAHRVRPG